MTVDERETEWNTMDEEANKHKRSKPDNDYAFSHTTTIALTKTTGDKSAHQ